MRRNTRLEILTVFVFLLFVGLIAYYAFYPFKVTQLHSISINSPEYCLEELVNIEIDFTKYMDITAEIRWFIVDGIIIELDSPGVSRPIGQNRVVVSKFIPRTILPGTYNFRVQSTYNIHPLRTPTVVSWDTPKFEVIDCEKEPWRRTPVVFTRVPSSNVAEDTTEFEQPINGQSQQQTIINSSTPTPEEQPGISIPLPEINLKEILDGIL